MLIDFSHAFFSASDLCSIVVSGVWKSLWSCGAMSFRSYLYVFVICSLTLVSLSLLFSSSVAPCISAFLAVHVASKIARILSIVLISHVSRFRPFGALVVL